MIKLLLLAPVVVTLAACKSTKECDEAKTLAKYAFQTDVLQTIVPLANRLASECPSDDTEAQALLERAGGLEIHLRESEQKKRASEKFPLASRQAAIAALADFRNYLAKALKAPKKAGTHVQCHRGSDPDAGWCDVHETHDRTMFSTRWHQQEVRALQFEAHYLPRYDYNCQDIDDSARQVRRWRREKANKTNTRCQIRAGDLLGYEVLIQLAWDGTHVSLFAPRFLARDSATVDTLENQGVQIPEGR